VSRSRLLSLAMIVSSAVTVGAVVSQIILPDVSAVTSCVRPPLEGKQFTWPSGTPITVTISGFSAASAACVKTAVDTWNTAETTNGQNIQFVSVITTNPAPVGPTGATNVYAIENKQPVDVNQRGGETTGYPNAGATHFKNAESDLSPQITDCTALTEVAAHEIGHTLGLDECKIDNSCTFIAGQSVMEGYKCLVWDNTKTPPVCLSISYNNPMGTTGPTSCDTAAIASIVKGCLVAGLACSANLPCCTGTTCSSGQCKICQTDCPTNDPTCIRCGSSPIVLDLDGKGFQLTSALGGVLFDISGTGNLIQLGWTAKGANNGFLALPGPDGEVHNGKQLFGNFTAQPVAPNPNGFAALAVYDDPKNGGNGDGVIDARDAIFASLRIWVDLNHDGVSQPSELHTLPSVGVNSLSLKYREAARVDEYGNAFRFVAKVNPGESNGSTVEKKAYDVFFVQGDPNAGKAGCPVPNIAPQPSLMPQPSNPFSTGK